MPLINDSERSLDALGRAASEAGATWLYGNVLFLKPCAKQVFMPFVEQHFPKLARRYRERFERAAYLRGEYVEVARERVEAVRQRYGMNRRSIAYDPEQFSDQLSLWSE
jgi:DNA repair photolyase